MKLRKHSFGSQTSLKHCVLSHLHSGSRCNCDKTIEKKKHLQRHMHVLAPNGTLGPAPHVAADGHTDNGHLKAEVADCVHESPAGVDWMKVLKLKTMITARLLERKQLDTKVLNSLEEGDGQAVTNMHPILSENTVPMNSSTTWLTLACSSAGTAS